MFHAWRTRRDGASNSVHVTSAAEVPFILFRVFSGCGSPFKQVEVLTLHASAIFLESDFDDGAHSGFAEADRGRSGFNWELIRFSLDMT